MAETGNYGIMEGAYFVGRKELLEWINNLLELDYTKVEQVASGAAFCQLMDLMYPGSIALSAVQFDATLEYEFVANFKQLQKAFDKAKITKWIDIPKLTKAKYQDNLEFLQWMKRYVEGHYSAETRYPAKEKREAAMKARRQARRSVGGANLSKLVTANKENKATTTTSAVPSSPRTATARVNSNLAACRRMSLAAHLIDTSSVATTNTASTKPAAAEQVKPKRIAKRVVSGVAKRRATLANVSSLPEGVIDGVSSEEDCEMTPSSPVPVVKDLGPVTPTKSVKRVSATQRVVVEEEVAIPQVSSTSLQHIEQSEASNKIAEMQRGIGKIVDEVVAERNLYLQKLKAIETLCKSNDQDQGDLIQRIQDILFLGIEDETY